MALPNISSTEAALFQTTSQIIDVAGQAADDLKGKDDTNKEIELTAGEYTMKISGD